jgi:hypothetical protein
MECLKPVSVSFVSAVFKLLLSSHTTTHKPTATPDNPAQLEYNCSGHSDFYTDLNFVRLLLRIKVVNTDAADVTNAESNTVSCINNVQHLMFSSLCVSWNGNPVTLHVTNYFKAYRVKLLHYGGTTLVSSFWIQQRPTDHTQQIKPTQVMSHDKIT